MKTIQLTIAIATLALTITLPLDAATVFSENFESYAPGSNLLGQGGWVDGWNESSVVTIAPGTFLSSQVLDGRAATGLFRQSILDQPITLNPTNISTLRFTAYASSSVLPTHNQEVLLGKLNSMTNCGMADPPGLNCPQAGWAAQYNYPGKRWTFFAGTNSFDATGGFDAPVNMSIFVEGSSNRVYGQYDFGSGLQQTPSYVMPPGYIAELNALRLYVDHRSPTNSTGMEVDNIVIEDNSPPIIRILRAVKLEILGLEIGTNYQLQTSTDLTNWVDSGPPFIASTNSVTECLEASPQSSFWRLKTSP